MSSTYAQPPLPTGYETGSASRDPSPRDPGARVNLAFFLTPLAEVAWLLDATTVQDAVHAMRDHRFTAVPLLDEERQYVGTITAADLLHWLSGEGSADVAVGEVPRQMENRAVGIDTDVRGILALASDQTFIPVVDSRAVLMGIVTRKAILTFYDRLLGEHGLLPGG